MIFSKTFHLISFRSVIMERRKFVGNSIAGVALLAFGIPPFKTQAKEVPVKPILTTENFELDEVTIDTLQQKMKSGEYTSKTITEMYLKRVAAIDKDGPHLSAVIELNPDALSIAHTMDEERKSGHVRGPLHGIPVLIKDNINTADKMMTTAGSIALEGNKASKDAFIVAKLREAGAVLLGKTNLSEWANFRSTKSSSGWSSRGGQTRNPYVLHHSPGGSSAGSGVAVAANLCAVAIGTETDGSITCPASLNGIVGIKPTVGLVSRSGIIPISHTQDTAGPMTRTVKDAAILLDVIMGRDPEDKVTLESKAVKSNYTSFLDSDALRGKRIGIDKKMLNSKASGTSILKEALAVMKSKGAEIIELEFNDKLQPLGEPEFTVLEYEFKDGLNQYLSKSNSSIKSLRELIAFNKDHAREAMPFFKQELLEMSDKKGDLSSQEYTDALSKMLTSRAILDDLMKVNRLDAITGFTYGAAWSIDIIHGDQVNEMSFSSPAAISGYPHITVPGGLYHGLPVGISFMGGAYSEGSLFALAYAFEQATKKRVAPVFLNEVVR